MKNLAYPKRLKQSKETDQLEELKTPEQFQEQFDPEAPDARS